MLNRLMLATSVAALVCASGQAFAAGELHIYNWGNYTNPKLIDKFSKQYDVKVTLDDYDSNATMMSKVRAGNSGYDIVVPSDYAVKIMIGEGLLAKTEPDKMSNFKNVKPDYVDVYWDNGRHYTVPWQIGTTSFAVNTAKYKGNIDSFSILFDPPKELRGKINMLDDAAVVVGAAERYLGIPRCTTNGGPSRADLKKVNDLLMKAKSAWKTFSYSTIAKMTAGDVDASEAYNGAAYRMRKKVPTIKYAYPKEGIEGWMDNVAVLKDAPDMENAKLFQNFVMDPENAALISAFAGYSNGIEGSLQYLPKDFATAPEINPPKGSPKPEFVPPCPPDIVKITNQIWTNVKK